MLVNFCQRIQCPYAPKGNDISGCQLYSIATLCHLWQRRDFGGIDASCNGYWITAPDTADLERWKRVNDEHLQSSPRYQQDRLFQQQFPECEIKYPDREVNQNV